MLCFRDVADRPRRSRWVLPGRHCRWHVSRYTALRSVDRPDGHSDSWAAGARIPGEALGLLESEWKQRWRSMAGEAEASQQFAAWSAF